MLRRRATRTRRTAELRDRFTRDGFVHLPGFCPASQVDELRRAVETARERVAEENPLSLETMRFRSNLFYDSEVLQRFLTSLPVVELVSALRGPDLWVRWDQAVWKGPDAPVFPWHQDNGYTGLAAEHLQLWVALTSMTPDNGGLAVWPGAHRRPAAHHWVGNHVELDVESLDGRPLDLDVAAGDVVAFSSFLPHATVRNRTAETRLAYVAEYLPLEVDDAGVPAPHLVACRGGRPTREWVGTA